MPKKKPLVYDNENYQIAKLFEVNKFGELLEGALVRESKERTRVRFTPSGLGYSGSCPRYWYYAFNGAMHDYSGTTPEAMSNMNAGTDAGARIAKMLEDAGVLIEAEEFVEQEDPPIGGYIDAIIEWQGVPVVCEVKTTKDMTWQYRTTNNKVPGYQLIQLLIYMRIKNIDRGFFLTENKDSHKIFILPVKMTEAYATLVDNVFDWMKKVKDNADNGELPKRPFERTSMECKGCELRPTCWAGVQKQTQTRVATDPNPGVVDLPKLELPK